MKRVALIPIAWPNMVARAPEKFLKVLRKIRLMKNINVLVGHAALLVVTENKYIYTDFGRYITPKGFGRARSSKTDPKLKINVKPIWSAEGKLLNIQEVFYEMELNAKATHGENELYASVMYDININSALDYIDEIQDLGYIPYSGMKKKDSNCARFVTNIMLSSLNNQSKIYKRLRRPVTVAPTPFFNVLAGNEGCEYMIFHQGKLSFHKANLRASRADILKKLSYSFRTAKAKLLPSDIKEGLLETPEKPTSLNENAKYLGGIGEGAWYAIETIKENIIVVNRYYHNGDFEFSNSYVLEPNWFGINKDEIEILHDSHHAWITLLNKNTNETKRFYALNKEENGRN